VYDDLARERAVDHELKTLVDVRQGQRAVDDRPDPGRFEHAQHGHKFGPGASGGAKNPLL
jgi:hypothetical protein